MTAEFLNARITGYNKCLRNSPTRLPVFKLGILGLRPHMRADCLTLVDVFSQIEGQDVLTLPGICTLYRM